MSSVALVTWEGLPDLGEDDQLLREALVANGVTASAKVWSDGGVRWEAYDLVVLRSTWDYHRRLEEFLRWVGVVERATGLLNHAPTVRWNSHKTYLRDLERSGIPIVPTVWGSEIASLTATLRGQGWDRAVLKPAVSASGEGARLLRIEERDLNEEILRDRRGSGEVLVQPYLPAVEVSGERSLVFFDGVYSHAVLRAPRLSSAPTLREGDPVEPSSVERELAARAVATVEPTPLYARVDLVAGPTGSPVVMELELIEPLLYLGSRAGAAARFARALEGRIR